MATAKGGETANGASSSHGGGGAGGKFRKKSIRRQTKPYDRPPTALRVNSEKSSWLRKMVVEPASKLISYGADRFFAPLLRKRLPPPPPSQPPETEVDVSNGVQGAVHNLEKQDGAQETAGGNFSQPLNSSSSNGLSELEQLLTQRTFTRPEIVYLSDVLQSKAVEVSMEDVAPKNVDTATDYARHKQFASGFLEENRNGGNRSAFMSTPIVNSKVMEDADASPAELAKAYMGSRTPRVSPSVLGMRSHVGREATDMFNTLLSASSSPIMALTKKAPNSMAAPDNGFITPRSRGRSAIYNMARTPYSKAHLTSNLKGTGISSNGNAAPSMSSSFFSPMESGEKLESHPMSLKRRNSVFDDEFGSVGPIRRLRQKSNLLASRIHQTTNGEGIMSHPKQTPLLIGEPGHKASKDVGENENESVPTSKSNEVASKILQHLEKMTPKEKSSESKLVVRRDKSPFTLTPRMLSKQALSSMEDVDSSMLLLDVQDDHTLGDRLNDTSADAHNFSAQKQEEKIAPKKSVAPVDELNSVPNNDSMSYLKASTPSTSATDFIVETGASQPPQETRAFRMSVEEDDFEQDDDEHCNGLAPRPFSENNGPMETSPTNEVTPPEESKPIQPADEPHLAPISRKTSEANSSAATLGIVSNDISLPASEETNAASQSANFPLLVDALDKPRETYDTTLFGTSSEPVEKVASLPSESSKEAELKIESSSSGFNISTSTSSQVKVPESEKSSHLNEPFEAGDINGKSGSVPSAASNEPPPISSLPPLSFPATSNDANQQPVATSPLFTSLNGGESPVPTSTSAASSGSIFGLTTNPSSSAASVFKFGSSVEPAASVSAAPTTSTLADKKAELDQGFGGFLSNVAPFSAASPGSTTFGFGSAPDNNLQDSSSLFANASKPLLSDSGVGLLGTNTTTQSVISSASPSLPAFNVNSSTSFGSTSSSQGFSPSSAFGFTSSSTISTLIPASSAVKFGTEVTAVESSTAPSTNTASDTSSIFATAVSSGSTAPVFGFTANANSSGSVPVTSTASSLISGTSSIFAFGGSSSSPSSGAPNSSSVFGFSALTSSSPSTGFAFGAPAASSSTPSVFNNPSSSGSAFSFTSASPSILSSPSAFGNPTRGFGAAASPDQMNAEDSMAEDNILQTSVAAAPPSFPVFGQQMASPTPSVFGQQMASSTPSTPSVFGFGSTSTASQPNPFMFGGQQQNQAAVPQQSPSPFQASGSLDQFNAGGSFSLGSGGGDKSGRKVVKINRNRNRRR